MFEITARTSQPYSAVCYIRCEWSDGTRSGASGVVVGANDVLTAMHVVYDQARGGWARKIDIFPGADTRPVLDTPYGVYSNVASLSGRAANWDLDGDGYLTATESQGDLALIGLQSRIGDVTGILATSSARVAGSATLAGYPGRGTGLMAEVAYASPANGAGVYQIGTALGPGSSGGPLLTTGADGKAQVLGIASAGNTTFTQSTYAGLFGTGTAQWLASAVAANDSLLGGMATGFSFRGGVGRDSFYGTSAIDSVTYDYARADYRLAPSSTGWTVTGNATAGSGIDDLVSVERLRFADGAWAFDLSGNAGKAALMLGAVAGTAAFQNRGLVGAFLSYFDAGHSLAQGAETVIRIGFMAQTAGGADDATFVRQVWRSVFGSEAPADAVQTYVGALQGGATTQAQLLAAAAQLPQNASHVDLVGLSQTGLAYLG